MRFVVYAEEALADLYELLSGGGEVAVARIVGADRVDPAQRRQLKYVDLLQIQLAVRGLYRVKKNLE